MTEPTPTRPDPFFREREHWSQALYPICMALTWLVVGIVLAVRL